MRPLGAVLVGAMWTAACVFAAASPVLGGVLNPEERDTENEETTQFDFLDEIHRAHIRKNGLYIDFGRFGHEKYTGLGEERIWHAGENDASDYATLNGSRGELRFFADDGDVGAAFLGIRARARTASRAALFLNRRYLGELSFPRGEFVFGSLGGAEVRAGENLLEILPKSDGDVAVALRSLDIDYLRVIPDAAMSSSAHVSEEEPFDALSSTPNGTVLDEDASLSYNVFIPEASRLRLLLDATDAAAGQIEILVKTDSGALISRVYDAVDGEVSVPLFGVSGQAATITFSALMGGVRLKDARLLRPVFSAQRPLSLPAVKNVLVILIDTLRRDRLRVYNPFTDVFAPGLGRVAAQSLVFDNAVAQSNWTKPSTATLLSGLYPSAHSANTHRAVLSDAVTTLPTHLRKQGFITAGFVANGYISPQFGFGLGWDDFGLYDSKQDPARGRQLFSDVIRWMKHRPRDRRFFAYVHTTDVHAPYRSPRRIWSRYDPARYRGGVRPAQTVGLINQVRAGSLIPAWRDRIRLTALYNGAVSYHDQAIDRLMQTLKQLDVLDDTVVVVTSDHGEELFDHGSVGHGHTLYKELVNIPLIVRLPGRADVRARHIGEMVGLIDVFPTLCELLRVECPAQIQGRSVVPVVTGEGMGYENEVVISESPSHRAFALQNERFKAVVKKNAVALYRKSVSSFETEDQSRAFPIARMAMTDILGDHLHRLTAWQNRSGIEEHRSERPKSDGFDEETQARLRALGYMGD